MRHLVIGVVLVGLLCPVVRAEDPAKRFKSEQEAFAYAVGIQFALSLKSAPFPVDMAAVLRAMTDVAEGKKAVLTEDEAQSVQRSYIMKWQQEEQAASAEKSKAWFTENAKKKGVKETETGLQYLVLKEGKGAKPKMGETVSVHYRGTLLDGKEFDSSYNRGKPMEFEVGRVIPGWNEGLQLMAIGSKYKFFIPSSLGYGPRGAGRAIPPNSTLIFEVELLEIKKAE